ncbi:MAG: FAD-dependent oxidoreductase [Candidatus Liptonbacteria bacterium]|nr:FAD-dependent oxidoreductase [Candidatus Liptonbacteria bacterium]
MKKIAVLGAGFGGLRAAIRISKKLKALGLLGKYEAVLIDRNDHHTYTPLLYEVATTSKKTADLCELHKIVAYKIIELIKHLPITFIRSEIKAIDFINGNIKLANNKDIACDYAVLALGSETNYFNIKGLKENSLPLRTLFDAIKIRDTMLNFIEDDKSELDVVIGGGGATGVEFASELKMWCGEFEKEYPQKCRLNITIIEGAKTILPGFSPKIIGLVKKRLDTLGVRLMEEKTILAVGNNEVILEDGQEIKFDALVWAGGTKAPSILADSPLKTETRGKIETLEKMECVLKTADLKMRPEAKLGAGVNVNPMFYAVGDNTCVHDPKTRKPVAGVARAAIDEADIASYNLIEEIKANEIKNYKAKTKTYSPRDYPYVIPVGGKFAVAKIGPIVISGFFGWIFKGLIELNYLASIMPVSKAVKVWLNGLKIFIQNDRLG